MSTHASAQPHRLSGTFFPSVAVRQDGSGYRIDDWMNATVGMLAPRATPWLPEERPDTLAEWRFGDLTLTREIRRTGQVEPWLRPSQRGRRHGSITLLRAGNDRAPSALIVSPRASLAQPTLEWLECHAGEDCEVVTLLLPMDVFEGQESDVAQRARCIDTAAGSGALLAQFMRQLAGQLGHIPDDQAALLAVATRALVVACTAPASAHRASATPCIASGVVERTRLVVQRNMASPDFGPPQLARLLAMSRSKLYRLLDGDGGVAHFINRERLAQAWRDLTAPGEAVSVHAIANQVGFRDHSTFSRAFRREYGCSPTEARERALLVQPETAPALASVPAQGIPACAGVDCEALPENGMISPVLGFSADPAGKECW